jgi:hypothetical protein
MRLATFGSVFVAAAANAPDLDFMNRVHQLWPEDAHRLPNVLAFYASTGIALVRSVSFRGRRGRGRRADRARGPCP